MVCTPIYYFSAPQVKYLEPATSSHPIEAQGYEIRLDFISLVREINFAGGFASARHRRNPCHPHDLMNES
jgi:hypothetical protein